MYPVCPWALAERTPAASMRSAHLVLSIFAARQKTAAGTKNRLQGAGFNLFRHRFEKLRKTCAGVILHEGVTRQARARARQGERLTRRRFVMLWRGCEHGTGELKATQNWLFGVAVHVAPLYLAQATL
jgi:hypothetical protein